MFVFVVFKGLVQEPVTGFKLEGEAIEYCRRMNKINNLFNLFHYKKVKIV